jgi:hypothetical protein
LGVPRAGRTRSIRTASVPAVPVTSRSVFVGSAGFGVRPLPLTAIVTAPASSPPNASFTRYAKPSEANPSPAGV